MSQPKYVYMYPYMTLIRITETETLVYTIVSNFVKKGSIIIKEINEYSVNLSKYG